MGLYAGDLRHSELQVSRRQRPLSLTACWHDLVGQEELQQFALSAKQSKHHRHGRFGCEAGSRSCSQKLIYLYKKANHRGMQVHRDVIRVHIEAALHRDDELLAICSLSEAEGPLALIGLLDLAIDLHPSNRLAYPSSISVVYTCAQADNAAHVKGIEACPTLGSRRFIPAEPTHCLSCVRSSCYGFGLLVLFNARRWTPWPPPLHLGAARACSVPDMIDALHSSVARGVACTRACIPAAAALSKSPLPGFARASAILNLSWSTSCGSACVARARSGCVMLLPSCIVGNLSVFTCAVPCTRTLAQM